MPTVFFLAQFASSGYFIKALYPTRGFGDADFKELVHPKPVVVATPTGVGVGYEGEAVEMQGPGPFWLLVGCDGLWDFMKEGQIQTVCHIVTCVPL